MRHFRISRYPVHDDRGELLGVGAVVDDVSELKQAEQRLERLLEREREARAQVEAAHAEQSLEYGTVYNRHLHSSQFFADLRKSK